MDDIKNEFTGASEADTHEVPQPVKPKKKFKYLSFKGAIYASVFVAFAVAGWFGVRVYNTWSQISDRGTNAILPPALSKDIKQLRGEGDGRVNILVLGMGGSGHSGGQLSDTIMIVSIDPETGQTSMLSLPRDLWVPVPGSGNFTKINALSAFGGPKMMKQGVSNILDIPIHYYISLDFKGFTKIVDAVGGVDINNKTNLYDYAYPCDGLNGYCPFSLKKGKHHLNGKVALQYARCRKGTCGSDFGRASRQQEVLLAVGEKARTSETLLNPIKIDQILAGLGKSVRTDLGIYEIKKFTEIGKKTDVKAIKRFVLTNEANNFLVSGYSVEGGSILKPKTGNFKKIQQYVHSIFVDPWLKKENARIELLNGSLTQGLAAQLAKILKNYNYNVARVAEADKRDYRESQIIDYSGGKNPYTLKYLELRFGVKATAAPAGEKSEYAIRVIIGNSFKDK